MSTSSDRGSTGRGLPGDGTVIDPSLWASPSPPPKGWQPVCVDTPPAGKVKEELNSSLKTSDEDLREEISDSPKMSDEDLAAFLQQLHQAENAAEQEEEYRSEAAAEVCALSPSLETGAVGLQAEDPVQLGAVPPLEEPQDCGSEQAREAPAEVAIAEASPIAAPRANAIGAPAEAADAVSADGTPGEPEDVTPDEAFAPGAAAHSAAPTPIADASAVLPAEESLLQIAAVPEAAELAVVAEPEQQLVASSDVKQQRSQSRQLRVRSRAAGRRHAEALPLMDVAPRSPRRPSSHSATSWPSFDALASYTPWTRSLWPPPITTTRTGEVVKTFEGPRAKRSRLAALSAERK